MTDMKRVKVGAGVTTDADRTVRDLGLAYEQAMHGVQSGVAYEISSGQGAATPKHLRVGINTALVDGGALAALLIEKGVFTELEYLEHVRLFANEELAAYEERNAPLKFR